MHVCISASGVDYGSYAAPSGLAEYNNLRFRRRSVRAYRRVPSVPSKNEKKRGGERDILYRKFFKLYNSYPPFVPAVQPSALGIGGNIHSVFNSFYSILYIFNRKKKPFKNRRNHNLYDSADGSALRLNPYALRTAETLLRAAFCRKHNFHSRPGAYSKRIFCKGIAKRQAFQDDSIHCRAVFCNRRIFADGSMIFG